MTISDELFKLIKSLTMQEKRYFKLYSSLQKGEKKYIALFDAIDKQVSYDENKIVKKHNLRNISVAKNKLNVHILKSLRSFHSNKTSKREVEELIDYAEILRDKKQVNHALKCIRKAKKIALDNELYEILLSVSQLELKTLELTLDIGKIENYFKTETKKHSHYWELIKNKQDYSNLASKLTVPNFIRSDRKLSLVKKNIQQLKKHPLLSSPKKAITFSSLERYYQIHYLCASLLNIFNTQDFHRQNEWVACLERDRNKLNDRWYLYLGAMSRLIIIQNYLGLINSAERTYKRVISFVLSLPSDIKSSRLFHYLSDITVNYMAMKLDIPEAPGAIRAWNELQVICTQNNIVLKEFNTLPMYGNLCYAHFLMRNHKEALRFSNIILNTKTNRRQDIIQLVKLYRLILYYEIGNREELRYMEKSFERTLIKFNGSISKYEKIILNYFGLILPKVSTRQEELIAFKKWKYELNRVSRKSAPHGHISQFDLISWIESKIEKRPFAEVIRNKNPKKS